MEMATKSALALVLAGGLASPVLAATATPTDSQAPAAQQMSSPKMSNMKQQITNDLNKAGFTDIKVMSESITIHAKDSKGNPVIMVVNPDSFTEVTEASPPSATSGVAPDPAGDKGVAGAIVTGNPAPPTKP